MDQSANRPTSPLTSPLTPPASIRLPTTSLSDIDHSFPHVDGTFSIPSSLFSSPRTDDPNARPLLFHSNDDQIPTVAPEEEEEDPQHLLNQGIWQLLTPAITTMDDRLVTIQASQRELSDVLERLLSDLQRVDQMTVVPPRLHTCVQRLQDGRRKITDTNSMLRNVKERLQRLHTQVQREPSFPHPTRR
ncbi:hypothetical protein IWQ62_001186 [Dispira parvispora]|uniref:Biogenesis of lysosome-related organelles complex 1 subunit 7 n=1 Tax=Dispira parvispora TaxID=1520584 RepID=A0A9W8AYZ6_9FUNG|nr:hypothetical protein IWQ62_001186 [Dispira parvispora]